MNGSVFHEGQQNFETESVFSDYIEYFLFLLTPLIGLVTEVTYKM